MKNKQWKSFSDFLFLSTTAEVANFFQILNFKYSSRGYYHYPPTYRYYPPSQILEKDSYPYLDNSNIFCVLVCG